MIASLPVHFPCGQPQFKSAQWLTLLALLLALAGCAEPKYLMRMDTEQRADKVAPVWPVPPDVPRYRYVGQLKGDENFV